MKPYMAYSRNAGPSEGALLVIANTAKEARLLAWRSKDCPNVNGWTDQGVRLIRDPSTLRLANQKKIKADRPHVIREPVGCQSCDFWGIEITADNLCGRCNEYPGDELIHCLIGLGE